MTFGDAQAANGRDGHGGDGGGVATLEIPDDQLVIALRHGDASALGTLFDRHHRAVYAYLRCRLLQPSDAEDLCQDVFLRCIQAKGEFAAPEQVRPWLIGIARNVLREYVRRQHRRKEVAWTLMCLDVDEQKVEEEGATYDDVIGLLPGCMETLGPNAREALEMHYRSKMRLAKIGERLRRSEGAVKLLMFRARQALKMCIGQRTGCAIDVDADIVEAIDEDEKA
jgi:RNA polymerase sigma-70 factor, ECF subfamily